MLSFVSADLCTVCQQHQQQQHQLRGGVRLQTGVKLVDLHLRRRLHWTASSSSAAASLLLFTSLCLMYTCMYLASLLLLWYTLLPWFYTAHLSWLLSITGMDTFWGLHYRYLLHGVFSWMHHMLVLLYSYFANVALSQFGIALGSGPMVLLALLCPVLPADAGLLDTLAQRHAMQENASCPDAQTTDWRPVTSIYALCMRR